MNRSLWEGVLPAVARPTRYTGGEWNAVLKPHHRAKVRFALVYPDLYEVGMSHLGLRILYSLLNGHPDFLAERCFTPAPDMEAALRSAGIPLLSLESQTPLADFDVIGFSLPYELTYTNLLTVLDLAGLPLRAADRQEGPLVIAGGPCAANPEPVADFLDAVALGDGEELILEVARTLAECKGEPKPSRLRALARIPGVYIPSLYRPQNGQMAPVDPAAPARVSRRIIENLDLAPYPVDQVVPFLETVHDRVTLEIMRGCTRGCRFCQAGMIYRPRRARSVENLVALAERTLCSTGWDEVSLLAFNAPDHDRIEELLDQLARRLAGDHVTLSLPSLRLDTFSVELAARLRRTGRSGGSLTFAPEAASERLRRVINKGLSEEDLFQTAQAALTHGWNALKLYFVIGLPTERMEEVEEIGRLVSRLERSAKDAMGPRAGRLRISISVNVHIPKPHTPFQWEAQDPPELIREKQARLKAAVPRRVQLSWGDPDSCLLEAALARGDRQLSRVIERAWRLGARLDSWQDHFDFARWRQAFQECGLDPADYACRPRDFAEPLAWDHLDFGVSKKFLIQEARAAREESLTPDCQRQHCPGCGACARSAA